MIDALPEIVARHPRTVYVVLGATHPHVKQHHGETYRRSLEKQAERIGVRDNVIFENRFVEHHELVSYLAAADIYVTPYLKEEQSTSGTLAYAVGCGKAVISTPYRYAVEMLADGRGILVPCRDPQTIAREVIGLLDDPAKRELQQERAAVFGKAMSWPIVARTYLSTFDRAHRSAVARDAATLPPKPLAEPTIDLSHLRRLTDDTGVLQHATFSVPRRDEGYCTDDNARALLVMTLLEDEQHGYHDGARALSSRYLAFLDHAWNPSNGRFRNFMTYGRAWCEDDSHGRALWALGAVAGRSRDSGWSTHARGLFEKGLTAVPRLKSPRAWAYALLGIDEDRARNEDEFVVETIGGQLSGRTLWISRPRTIPFSGCFSETLLLSSTTIEVDEDVLVVVGATDGIGDEGVGAPVEVSGQGMVAHRLVDPRRSLEAIVHVGKFLEKASADGEGLVEATFLDQTADRVRQVIELCEEHAGRDEPA